MEDLKTRALTRIARQLANLGCDYMIVPGEGKPLMKGKFTHHVAVKHGEYSRYLSPFIDHLQPGDTAEIPIGNYPVSALHSTLSARCVAIFGKGNFMSSKDDEREVIEVLCLDRDAPEAEADAEAQS